MLQQKGLISYQRGSLTIHKRKRIESMACDCYALISAGSRV